MRNYLLMVLAGFLLFFVIGSLSSCTYNYKVKYVDDRTVEVIKEDSPSYYIGDTITVFKYNKDEYGIINAYTHRKAVIIPLVK